MPKRTDAPLNPDERRRQVASILAGGVVRWRRRVRATTISDAQESAPAAENRLELSRETRLSVSEGTREFTPRGQRRRCMKLNLAKELAALEQMTVGRLQANAEGGLSERALRRAEELASIADEA